MVQLLFLVVVGYSPGFHAPCRRSSVSFCSACRSRQDERGLLKTMGSGPLSCFGVVPHHHRGQMLRHLPSRITGQDSQRPVGHFTRQRTAEPESVRHQEPLQTFSPALAGFTDRRKHNLRYLFAVAVQLALLLFVQQAVQFAPVSFFLTHLWPADAVPLQLLDLAGDKPCACQQVSQRGLPDLLIQAVYPLRLQRGVQLAVPGAGLVRRRGNVPRALLRPCTLIDLHPGRNPHIVAGLQPGGGLQGIARQARNLPGRVPLQKQETTL